VTAPQMYQRRKFAYFEGSDFEAIQLPYHSKRSAQLSMVVLLPAKGIGVDSFGNGLSANKFRSVLVGLADSGASKCFTRLRLPKFQMEAKYDLKSAFDAMGLSLSDRTNFSGISPTPMQVDQAIHSAFINVMEQGTEAAAVTALGMRTTSAPMKTCERELVVDRPFLFAIIDHNTETLLFFGRVADPSVGGDMVDAFIGCSLPVTDGTVDPGNRSDSLGVVLGAAFGTLGGLLVLCGMGWWYMRAGRSGKDVSLTKLHEKANI